MKYLQELYKEAKVPETLSPSQLQTYMSCNYKWYLQYAIGLRPIGPDYVHFAKGSYVHELLHYYYGLVQSGYMPGDPTLVNAIKGRIKEDLEQAENPDLEFFDHVARTVIGYIEHRSPVIDTGLQRLQIEHHLEVDLGSRILHGFTDLIYWDSDREHYVIRDHKTGNRDTYDLESVGRNSQLLTYGALFYKMTGEVPEVEINYVNSNPPKKAVKTPLWNLYRVQHKAEVYENHYDWLVHVAERQHSQVHSSLAPPLRNFFACGKCPYHLICSFDQKNLSTDVIVRSRYERKDSVQPKDSEEASESDASGGSWFKR